MAAMKGKPQAPTHEVLEPVRVELRLGDGVAVRVHAAGPVIAETNEDRQILEHLCKLGLARVVPARDKPAQQTSGPAQPAPSKEA